MWLGAGVYILATLLYFYMLSRLRFFSVQIAMTGLSIVFSMMLAVVLFHERPGIMNVAGAATVLLGIAMVLHK
jgi:drug/metabolite transporter (DMT)-like permease